MPCLLHCCFQGETKKLSQPFQGFCWPTPTTHPQDGAAKGSLLPDPTSHLGMRLCHHPSSSCCGHKEFAETTLWLGHPFGLSGGEEFHRKEQKPLVGNPTLEAEEEFMSSMLGHQVPMGQVGDAAI